MPRAMVPDIWVNIAVPEFLVPTPIDLNWWKVIILLATGAVAGFINTFSGGGAMITVPALILMGMPADIANATNRVGTFQQSITSAVGFERAGKLEKRAALPMLVPTMSGAALGALTATWIPVETFKPLILAVMIGFAVITLVLPEVIMPPEGTRTYSLRELPLGILVLFVAGVYAGMVQAGVGFILMLALAAGLRYDLTRTNALKVVCTGFFSIAALAVFIPTGHVDWVPAILIAAGMTVGAILSVKFALTVSQKVVKWVLFIMVCLTAGSALIFT